MRSAVSVALMFGPFGLKLFKTDKRFSLFIEITSLTRDRRLTGALEEYARSLWRIGHGRPGRPAGVARSVLAGSFPR